MIPLFSAKAANEGLDLSSALLRVLDSHWFVLGKEVNAFEDEFAQFIGASSCISLGNGTDALEIALRASGVGTGDFVACVANAGFYASTAIRAVGATPVYVDVEAASLNMSPVALDALLSRQAGPSPVKAMIVTHLYGQMAQVEALTQRAHAAGMRVIEDCAQAHGAIRNGRRAGSIGDLGCFSFYPTKNLGALGDGGAIVTNDSELAATCRSLRQYGWSTKYHVTTAGGRNSRLDEIQAAVLRTKLPWLDQANAARRAIAARYNAAFSDLPLRVPPSTAEDFVAHLYVIGTSLRDRLRDHLRDQQVATDVHYPIADHLQPAYPQAADAGQLAQTELTCRTVVSLPCFPGLPDADVDRVIASVRGFFDA